MRLCISCNTIKDDSDFYYLNKKGNGKCKECVKLQARKNRKENIEYYRELDKKRSNLPHRIKARQDYQKNNPDKFRAYKRKYALKNPQKRNAVTLVNNAKRDGKIEQKPCLICGDTNVQAHHEDYSKPLDVIWLCPKHHSELHKKRRI